MAQVMSMPRSAAQTLATNTVIRNTYLLLSMTLVWSAVTAYAAIKVGAPVVPWWMFMIFAIGMPFLIHRNRNSAAGLVLSFVYTGIFGFMLGPLVGIYASIDARIPVYAFATTAAVFGSLSMYALATRKDFSFLSGFLLVGFLVILAGFFANLFLQLPILSLMISSGVVMLTAAGMLFSTSRLINDGEANYIVIACSLFGDIWMMFLHLMNLMSFFMGDD